MNTVSPETREHRDTTGATMVMTTIKKVYILLWKNLIIKVRIMFAVCSLHNYTCNTNPILLINKDCNGILL